MVVGGLHEVVNLPVIDFRAVSKWSIGQLSELLISIMTFIFHLYHNFISNYLYIIQIIQE